MEIAVYSWRIHKREVTGSNFGTEVSYLDRYFVVTLKITVIVLKVAKTTSRSF